MGIGLGGADLQINGSTGTFAAAGTGAPVGMSGPFNVWLWGTFVGSVQLERSFNGGVNWFVCTRGGVPVVYTAAVTDVLTEPEAGILYRWNCTQLTSGTVNWRISQ